MDSQRFDDMTKTLAGAGSRRRFLKGVLGAAVGAVASAVGLAEAGAAPRLRVNNRCTPRTASQCPVNSNCTGSPRRCRCKAGFSLRAGRCTRDRNPCAGKPDSCPDANGNVICVNTKNDPNNCGGCGAEDPLNVCSGVESACAPDAQGRGTCVCPGGPDMEACNIDGTATCVNVTTDARACGGCGIVCPEGVACVDGHCGGGEICPAPNEGPIVINQGSGGEIRNCGECGVHCPAGSVCQQGACLCPGDNLHCPEYDNQCLAPATFDGQTSGTNPNGYCGDCGRTCAGADTCQQVEPGTFRCRPAA